MDEFVAAGEHISIALLRLQWAAEEIRDDPNALPLVLRLATISEELKRMVALAPLQGVAP